MAKNEILVFENIMIKKTNKEHRITMNQILSYMAEAGHPISSDTAHRYIKKVNNEKDVKIVHTKGKNAKYYLDTGFLNKEQTKFVIDAVCASNFINENLTNEIVEILLSSINEDDATELRRDPKIMAATKSENEEPLNNIEKIRWAIKKDKQISFNNCKYNKNKDLVATMEKKNTLSPFALVWANDRYYIYGYDTWTENGKYKERHYRVDKMRYIKILDESRTGHNQYSEFNARNYVSRRIGMFAGDEKTITIKANEKHINPMIDQFGKGIIISLCKEGNYHISFRALPSLAFLGWITGFEDVEILEPDDVREKMKQLIEKQAKMYKIIE